MTCWSQKRKTFDENYNHAFVGTSQTSGSVEPCGKGRQQHDFGVEQIKSLEGTHLHWSRITREIGRTRNYYFSFLKKLRAARCEVETTEVRSEVL